MAGKKYEAREKVMARMTRDGLVEENALSGKQKRVSRRETDTDLTNRPERKAESGEFSYSNKGSPAEETDVGRKRTARTYEKRGKEGELREAAPFAEENLEEGGKAGNRQRIRPEAANVPEGEEECPESTDAVQTQASMMSKVRESPGRPYAKAAGETAALWKKKMVQSYHREKDRKSGREKSSETSGENANGTARETEAGTLAGYKDELKKKSIKRKTYQEQKKAGRLNFDDGGMVHGAGRVSSAAGSVVSGAVHGKIHEEEEDNLGVKSVHSSELAAESAAKVLHGVQERRMKKAGYSSRLKQEEPVREAKGRLNFGVYDTEKDRGTGLGKEAVAQAEQKKESVRKFWQKKRIKQSYAAAKSGQKSAEEAVKATETIAVKAKRVLEEIVRRNKGIFSVVAVLALLFLLVATSFGSCAAVVQGGGTTVISTTYAAEDSEIYAVENAYSAMETALNQQINSMESTHPGYDEFQYQIDEISHNPYHLISYFTVKYGDFTYRQVKDELEEIFREQYSLNTEGIRRTVTETKTVRVGESLGSVVTSGYCNCSICCGQWSGGPTASGVMPTPNHTLAVDAASPFVPMGTKVIMNGVEYVVEDTGAFARYGVQFDVYYGDHATASAHGHQTWECFLADDNGGQEVEVTVTRDVNQFHVSLTNHSLDAVLRSRMNEEEEKRYGYYNLTYGNRDYLFDTHTLPTYGGGGFGYQIPSEALSDERFARMIGEAEKYLGYPYVWGGASPETSFDCSGFVSWVINNCGNGWNVGRQTADGLRSCCAQVSPSDAKPGDLIFFQGTYDTPGASHVGIYVGDGMMIHCGNPIQYTSINSAYWQQHFMAFGRLP